MLLNPLAVEKLKEVTRSYYYWGTTTHEQRNELARMFKEEAGRLLDLKAESAIKRVVELYGKEEITYERYTELIEQVSQEEETRGAAYGGTYARNRVFDFAQKALDRTKDQAYALSLAEVKKHYEVERRNSEHSINTIVQNHLAAIETLAQQHGAELKVTTQQQKEELMQTQEGVIEQTKMEIEQVLSRQLHDEREKREKEIREQEDLRPAREAARTAIMRVTDLEKQVQTHRRLKNGLVGLGCVIFVALILSLIFLSLPQLAIAILVAVMASPFIAAFLWKHPVSENTMATYQRQVAFFQTKSEDYAPLSEEERCTLLVQRIL